MEEVKVKMVAVTRYTLAIPELVFPMVGLRKDQEQPPTLNGNDRGNDWDQNHQNLMTMLSSKQMKPSTHDSGAIHDQRVAINQQNHPGCKGIKRIDDGDYSDSDPKSILTKASVLFNASYYDAALRKLGVLDFHLMLPPESHMAKEFGCGLASHKLGKWKNAKGYFNNLIELASSFNSSGDYALAYQFLGEIEMSYGQFAKAEKCFSTAVKSFMPNTVASVFSVELSESALYTKLGQCQKALQKSEEAISSMSKATELAKSKEELLEANLNMGHTYMHQHSYKQALHYYKESLRLSVELGDHKSKGLSHGNIGGILLHLTDSEKVCALDHLITAYHLSARYECNPQAVGRAVSNLANGYATLDDAKKALEYYETARGHFIYARDSEAEGRACGNIGNMHMILNNYEKAIEYYDEALTLLRDISSKEAAYHNKCLAEYEVAVAQEDYTNALVFAEETRARTVSQSISKKKKTLHSDATSIPMALDDIYKTVALCKVPVIFSSYCKSKLQLLLWVLVPIKDDDVKIKCCKINMKGVIGNSSLEHYIQSKLVNIGFNLFKPPSHEEEEAFAKLYDSIGKEIEMVFENFGTRNVQEFIFIPDNVTHLLPLGAMFDKQRSEYFGDRYRIRIYPSILSLRVMNMINTDAVVQIPRNERDCLVVGNPNIPPFIHDGTQWNLGRLPYAEAEAIQVSSILNVTPLVREHATKQGVLYRMRYAKIIHIATHGSGSAGFLAFGSSFPISKDGCADTEKILIYPSDIEGLNISAALVVLSSCQANRGSSNGDNVMGMAGAFLSAGAQSVLVSSFNVADESTCVFMQLFYQFLVDGFSSSCALQKSMQCMRCISKFSGYNHWSGFQLIGKDISVYQKNDHDSILSVNRLGKTSTFPREPGDDIKQALQNNNTNKIQLITGLPGSEPKECTRDYIKKYCHLYRRGVYWLNGRDDLLLETSIKLADLPQQCENESNDSSHRRLIVIDNILTNVKLEHLMDSETDVIMISDDMADQDDILNHIEETCSRSVNIISVKSLATTEVLKRVTYSLLKRSTFSLQDYHVQLFNKFSELTMGTATLTNFVTALLENYTIDELSIKINHCIKSVTTEKEVNKSLTTVSLTCNVLIKSFVNPEAQMLLNSLSIVGAYGICIPSFIIEEVENLIIFDSSLSDCCCFKELVNLSIIRKYPYSCVYRGMEKSNNLSNKYNKFYYIPKLICNAMLEQSEEAEHVLNTLLLLKAIELNILEDDNDEIKLELLFEILNILYDHLENDELLSRCIHLRLKIAYILHYSDTVS